MPVQYFKAAKRTHRFNENQKVWIRHTFSNHMEVWFKWRGKGRYVSGLVDISIAMTVLLRTELLSNWQIKVALY